MTISGQAFTTTGGGNVGMSCDGTNFWFNNKAGNSANDYVISKYTLSGTTLTYVSDVTCGSAAGSMTNFGISAVGNFYGVSSSDSKLRKFNSSGTIQYTTTATYSNIAGIYNFGDNFYIGTSYHPLLGYAKLNK